VTPPGTVADLATATLAWTEQWLDPDIGLLWNPEGSFDEVAPPRSIHLVPQSAWFALGLLARDGPGDRSTAAAVIDRLLDTQYDEPGSVWHGTFRRFHETPDPRPGAVEWVDYDPNWRQFIGTTFALVLRRFGDRIDDALAARIGAAIRSAIEGEPPERVQPSYSNIALMRAWLEVEAGHREGVGAWIERGEALGRAVAERFGRFGAFDEYNSPTYYGIDLYALALWAREPVSSELAALGIRMERVLWEDTASFHHAGLRNQCGPFSRSYGTDMRRYAALLGLWIWDAIGADRAPYPQLDRPFDHSHDTTMGPLVALVGSQVPPAVALHLRGFQGERTVERVIGDAPERVVTAWLGHDLMIGAEAGDLPVYAMGQFMPATIHGASVTLRVEHHGPTSARAAPGRLDLRVRPHHRRGGQPVRMVVEVPAGGEVDARDGRWQLPGLSLEVHGPNAADAVAARRSIGTWEIEVPAASGARDYVITVAPS
jgi:hypothetical protein